MAIQFARIAIEGRSSGGNACRKGAYNARSKITDERTNITYNFSNRGDNVFHQILLPEGVDRKFENITELMNVVEHVERKDNSQLLKDVVIALPDDKELNLQDRIEITKRIIEKRGWVKEGLAVQIDIHQPHDGENNWHAHLLVTTRRFTADGKGLFHKKARDLNPEFKTGKNGNFIIPEEILLQHDTRDVINDYFKELGLENRVDAIGILPQEHIGPIRMRSVLNQAAERNEERRIAEIEHLSNGEKVIDKVTRHLSFFTRGDLTRAVKSVPSVEARARLVEDAMSSKLLVALFQPDGSKTPYFTTASIRAEEEKLLRLSSYIADKANIFTKGKDINIIQQLITQARSNLSEEQHLALSQLLSSKSALGILRGRAGVGKSHVLRQLALIAHASNIQAIGLAPTHKAKEAFHSSGFAITDTVKGMLFKLANGRFSLPKNSLLVVDEAGMIGNDDYHELLRVVATRQCQLILAGDERQLASIGRGGMFEIFADKYGSSTILDIQRQESLWGKQVAMAMSEGNVARAVTILNQESRIFWGTTNTNAMAGLLEHWQKSNYEVSDRLIVAVKNKDVVALNHGVRQYLKQAGKLTGVELEVKGNHYMKGDRILMGKTSKELGVVNGDLGEILAVRHNRFVVSIANNSDINGKIHSKIVEFNPSEYSDFRHGYATSVFKAQGASIKDVYVFHDGFSGLRNSYVALSRNIMELKLYVNNKATLSLEQLIRQMSYDLEAGSSLHHLTETELENRQLDARLESHPNLAVRVVNSAYDFVAQTVTKLTDQYLPASEYYNYQEPKQSLETVSQVIDRVAQQNDNDNINVAVNVVEEKMIDKLIVGGNIPTSSAKEKFYAKADYARNKASRAVTQQAEWDNQRQKLRQEVGYKASMIAIDLLGDPNKRLSNGKELRFGENGKIAVRISGERAGTWYDFSAGVGGDMFDLVQEKQGGSFKQAADYLRQAVGISANDNSLFVEAHEASNKYVEHHQLKAQEQAIHAKKLKYSNDLYQRAKGVSEDSVAYRYLAEVRGVKCQLGDDVRTVSIFDKTANNALPALVAFARDADGNITGGQQLLLDSTTNGKANILLPKKSFGKITGSFVHLGGKVEPSDSRIITIMAEGIETALSVKQALLAEAPEGLNIQVLCSLGISNIQNYQAKEQEKIIIAADNDGIEAATNKTIETAKMTLAKKGAFVEIVRPEEVGDFNDLLQLGAKGEQEIQQAFKLAISKHTASSLANYIAIGQQTGNNIELSQQDKANLSYIQQYQLSESKIVDAYRQGADAGSSGLEQSRKSLEQATMHYQQHEAILAEAKQLGYKESEITSTKAMLGMNEAEAKSFCLAVHTEHLQNYQANNGAKLNEQISTASTVEQVINALDAKQKFLVSLEQKITYNVGQDDLKQLIERAKEFQAEKISEKLQEVATSLIGLGLHSEQAMLHQLKTLNNSKDTYQQLDSELEMYQINKSLASFDTTKQQSRHPAKTIEALAGKNRFLAGLKSWAKYPKMHDEVLMKAMEQAVKNEQNNVSWHLHKIVTLHLEQVQAKPEDINKILISSPDTNSAFSSLQKNYNKHVISQVNKAVQYLKQEGTTAKFDDQLFSCPTKYLEHVLATRTHEYFPRQQIEKIQQKQLGLVKEMASPTMEM